LLINFLAQIRKIKDRASAILWDGKASQHPDARGVVIMRLRHTLLGLSTEFAVGEPVCSES